MKLSAQTATILVAIVLFVGLPLMFYALGDAPQRSVLKDVISVATLLAFTAMLGQFFMARSNTWLLSVFKPPQIQKAHKYSAYTAVAIILLHPALIVLPRSLEGGIRPKDAFVTMITDLGNLGVVLGLIAWGLLLVLSFTALFRSNLMPHFTLKYRGWRYFHGGLAVTFTPLALWHSILLGRHTDVAMSVFFVLLAAFGLGLLARMYWIAAPRKPVFDGAAT